jgi:cytochrome b561
VRVVNRFAQGAPAPEPSIEPWQKTLSSAVHGSLYVLLLAMPVVGYVANSAFGAATPFFGLFTLPPVVGENQPLAERLFYVHKYAGWLVALLVALHVAGALQHYLIRRDGVLQRMLPRALGGT